MDAVRKDVEALVGKELKAANENFPLFHSTHEGYGVLLEELKELKDEVSNVKSYKRLMKKAIHENDNETLLKSIKVMGNCAVLAAVEAIQVAAMCEKFKMSLDMEEKAKTNSEPKNRDKVYCKECAYLNLDGDKPFCCHRNMSTNGLDDWCYHGKKRGE